MNSECKKIIAKLIDEDKISGKDAIELIEAMSSSLITLPTETKKDYHYIYTAPNISPWDTQYTISCNTEKYNTDCTSNTLSDKVCDKFHHWD